MANVLIRKARRSQAKLRMAFGGLPGSGKTYTAISVASGLTTEVGGKVKILVICTEHGSAAKYGGDQKGDFDFDILELSDFHPANYIEAIKLGESEGYDVIIIDSLSHAWEGKGGVLEQANNASAKYRGNTFAGWKDATPLQNALIEAIIQSRCHIIATMRVKADYVLETTERGTTRPVKVGMAFKQRDGMEYEFDIVASIDMNHTMIVDKTRFSAIDGEVIKKAGPEFGRRLANWLSDGVQEVKAPPYQLVSDVLEEISSLWETAIAMDLKGDGSTPQMKIGALTRRGISSLDQLKEDDAKGMISGLRAAINAKELERNSVVVAEPESIEEDPEVDPVDMIIENIAASDADHPETIVLPNVVLPERSPASEKKRNRKEVLDRAVTI